MKHLAIVSALTAGLFAHAPAIAHPADVITHHDGLPAPSTAGGASSEPHVARKHPALAAGLTLAAPTALIILSSRSTDFAVNFGLPIVGLTAGHLYAGEPLRGALVTVGATAIGLGAFALLHRSGGNGGGGAYAVGMFSVGLAAGLAAADAYWTVEQKNSALRGPSPPH